MASKVFEDGKTLCITENIYITSIFSGVGTFAFQRRLFPVKELSVSLIIIEYRNFSRDGIPITDYNVNIYGYNDGFCHSFLGTKELSMERRDHEVLLHIKVKGALPPHPRLKEFSAHIIVNIALFNYTPKNVITSRFGLDIYHIKKCKL